MEAGKWEDDLGEEVDLFHTSPALLAKKLQQATQRWHERRAMSRWHEDEERQEDRLCFDVVKHLANKNGDRQEQYLTKSAATMGIWTQTRLKDAGCEIEDTKCPMCHLAEDTIQHRCWLCTHPEVKKARDRNSSPVLRAWAAEEVSEPGQQDLFWVTGLFPHPVGKWPLAAKDNLVQVTDSEGRRMQLAETSFGGGAVCADGSATRSIVPEMRRATWAAVFMNKGSFQPRVVISGTVPRSLPQTAACAEHCALAMAIVYAEEAWEAHSDCTNVVKGANKSIGVQLSHQKVYAGPRRQALAKQGAELCQRIAHTPAHRTQEQIDALQGDERTIAIGNAWADNQAKMAMDLHPSWKESQVKDFDELMGRARQACLTIARTLKVFPSSEKAGRVKGDKTKATAEEKAEAKETKEALEKIAKDEHDWKDQEDGWYCCKCLSIWKKGQQKLEAATCDTEGVSQTVRRVLEDLKRAQAAGHHAGGSQQHWQGQRERQRQKQKGDDHLHEMWILCCRQGDRPTETV